MAILIIPAVNIIQTSQLLIYMGNSTNHKKNTQEELTVEWPDSDFTKIVLSDNTLKATIPLYNKQDYNKWVESQAKNPASTSRFALNPIKNSYKEGGMCGSGGNALIVYDDHPFTLSQQIQNRQRIEQTSSNGSRRFQQQQIWYLLWAVSDVGRRFHQEGYRVGNIHPKNILMDEEGVINLSHQFSWPGNKTSYDRALFERQILYLSPQDMKEVEIGRSQPETDMQKSQAFSTGLTAMDAVLLNNSNQLYEKKLYFDLDALNGKKANICHQTAFSNKLKHVILNLTQFQPEDRLTLIELNQWLQSNQAQILAFQPFTHAPSPLKLHQTQAKNEIKTRNFNLDQLIGNNIDKIIPIESQDEKYQILKQNQAQQFVYNQDQNNLGPKINYQPINPELIQRTKRLESQQLNYNPQDRPVSFGQKGKTIFTTVSIEEKMQALNTNQKFLPEGRLQNAFLLKQPFVETTVNRSTTQNEQPSAKPKFEQQKNQIKTNSTNPGINIHQLSPRMIHRVNFHSQGCLPLQQNLQPKIDGSQMPSPQQQTVQIKKLQNQYTEQRQYYSPPVSSFKYSIFNTLSNFPTSPKVLQKSDNFLTLIQEKIKSSRQNFPSE